jgi:hypothetical protein
VFPFYQEVCIDAVALRQRVRYGSSLLDVVGATFDSLSTLEHIGGLDGYSSAEYGWELQVCFVCAAVVECIGAVGSMS